MMEGECTSTPVNDVKCINCQLFYPNKDIDAHNDVCHNTASAHVQTAVQVTKFVKTRMVNGVKDLPIYVGKYTSLDNL